MVRQHVLFPRTTLDPSSVHSNLKPGTTPSLTRTPHATITHSTDLEGPENRIRPDTLCCCGPSNGPGRSEAILFPRSGCESPKRLLKSEAWEHKQPDQEAFCSCGPSDGPGLPEATVTRPKDLDGPRQHSFCKLNSIPLMFIQS